MTDETKRDLAEHLVLEMIEYHAERIEEDPLFKERFERAKEAGQRLRDTLTEEQNKLWLDEDSESVAMWTRLSDLYYRQGLLDGARLFRMLTGK
jgi:hypothetical protein